MMKTRVNGTVRPKKDAGLRRGIAAAAVLLIVCVLAVGVVSADEITVSNFGDLVNAITNAPSDSDLTIVVDRDIEVSGSDAIPAIKTNITLTTNNANYKIYRTAANDSSLTGMFTIQNGGNLTIQGNNSKTLTLDGNQTEVSDNGQTLVWINSGGNFTLANGGILTNNTAGDGGGVYVNGGNFTLADGGILTNNTASYGGGVYVNGGTFTMSGNAAISDNKAFSGGGVYVYKSETKSGTFTMSGGEISGNEAGLTGGGVFMSGGSAFKMFGGEISGNTAGDGGGGGVFMSGGSAFKMFGGEISGNMASDTIGGGVYVDSGTFTMESGTISDNTADEGGGVYVGSGTFKMSGGEISKNKAINCGGGVYVYSSMFSTFKLSGSSSVDGVYLTSEKVINVTAPLTTAQVTGIKLAKPEDGTKVVTFSSGVSGDDYVSRFTLDSSVIGFTLAYQSPDSIVLLSDTTPLPPSGDGNMENAFRVLFNDGATTLSVQTDLSSGDKLTKPETPVKDGYTFAGWYKDSACTNPWDFETGIPGDMTLYAKWTAAGSSGETEATATPTATATAVTTPQPTKTQTAAATTSAPEATTAAAVSPTLTQAPAPVAGALFGLLAAGVLLRRRFQ